MMQNGNRKPSGLEERAREAFARSVAGLDAATRAKLTRARHRALAPLERRPVVRLWFAWGPQAVAAAVAIAAVGAGSLLLRVEAPTYPAAGVADVGDFELLLDDDDLELIEELEFYAWLDEQPELRATDDDGAG